MPYKDIEKQREARNRWRHLNPEKYKAQLKKSNSAKWMKKHSLFYDEIKSYDLDTKVKVLYEVSQRTRKKMYEHFVIPFSEQIEEKISIQKKKARNRYCYEWKCADPHRYQKILDRHKIGRNKKKFKKCYSIYIKIRSYDIDQKAKALHNINGQIRKNIYKYFIVPFSDQIEEKIAKAQRREYFIKQKPAIKKRIDNQWGYAKKWMTDRGCDCGEGNITKLSFHHRDPSQKENTIRKMCKYSLDKVKAELKKGVVKCKNCHTIIHAGTSEEREEALIKQYLKAPPKKATVYRNKLMIWEFKKSLSCVKCGIDDPVILLFHHIDSKNKHKKISILYKAGRDTINKEIGKTACLCHNCHEDFHYLIGYHVPTTQQQLESYVGKKIIPLKAHIQDYLPIINQNVSEYYNLPFLIT